MNLTVRADLPTPAGKRNTAPASEPSSEKTRIGEKGLTTATDENELVFAKELVL